MHVCDCGSVTGEFIGQEGKMADSTSEPSGVRRSMRLGRGAENIDRRTASEGGNQVSHEEDNRTTTPTP